MIILIHGVGIPDCRMSRFKLGEFIFPSVIPCLHQYSRTAADREAAGPTTSSTV